MKKFFFKLLCGIGIHYVELDSCHLKSTVHNQTIKLYWLKCCYCDHTKLKFIRK